MPDALRLISISHTAHDIHLHVTHCIFFFTCINYNIYLFIHNMGHLYTTYINKLNIEPTN